MPRPKNPYKQKMIQVSLPESLIKVIDRYRTQMAVVSDEAPVSRPNTIQLLVDKALSSMGNNASKPPSP